MTRFFKCYNAISLPEQWDHKGQSYFLQRKFLSHADLYNPCNQRYYYLMSDDRLLAGACVYSLKIDLFTFSAIKSPVTMHVAGAPASVSCSGLIGERKQQDELIQYIRKDQKGLILILNIPAGHKPDKCILMNTLPSVEFSNDFSSWNEYEAHLRSDYRRRLRKISATLNNFQYEKRECNSFTPNHYDLYLQVWNRSSTRLEKLSQDFFKHLPEEFELVSIFHNNDLVAWHINLKEEDRLTFFFGGTNYSLNKIFNAYFNNLIWVIKEAIESGYPTVELGQTAEIPKTRLGGQLIEKKMALYHNNKVILFILWLLKPWVGYRRLIPVSHVFKNS